MPRPLSPLVTCVRLACHMSGTVYGNTADGFRLLSSIPALLFAKKKRIGPPTAENINGNHYTVNILETS